MLCVYALHVGTYLRSTRYIGTHRMLCVVVFKQFFFPYTYVWRMLKWRRNTKKTKFFKFFSMSFINNTLVAQQQHCLLVLLQFLYAISGTAAIQCPCIHTLYHTNTIDPILFLLINNYVPWWSCTSITILYYLYYYRYYNKK